MFNIFLLLYSQASDELELIDGSVMRFILGAHSKSPSEMLYLETVPLRCIIMIRRILYFQTVVTRDDQELTKRVYDGQKNDPYRNRNERTPRFIRFFSHTSFKLHIWK